MSVLDRAVSLMLPALPKPVVRFFSRRYIAGPTMEDAFRVVGELADQGAMSTLDILGELITSTEDALRNANAYSELIRRVAEDRLAETHVSVKLTALGLLLDRELCLNHMRRLLERATNADSFVRIDMEDSSCTPDTLWVYETLLSEFPGRIGAVLQSARRLSWPVSRQTLPMVTKKPILVHSSKRRNSYSAMQVLQKSASNHLNRFASKWKTILLNLA